MAHYVLLYRIYRKSGNLDIEKQILLKTENFNTKNIEGDSILSLICQINWKKYQDILLNCNQTLDIYTKNNKNKAPIDFISKKDIKDFINIIAKNYKVKDKSDKYILKLIKDKSKTETDDKIKLMNDYKYATHNLFRSSLQEVIVYMIYILEKYNNLVALPFKAPLNNNIINLDLKLSSDILTQKNFYYYPEFFYFIIFWENKDKYFISDKLMNNLKCLVKNKKYILIYLSLDISESLHANIILIDTHQKTIERFDPYGNINANDEIDIVLKDYFSYLTYFKYLKPSDYMKTSSFQTLSNEGIKRKQGDI